jgi:hypothetical protein
LSPVRVILPFTALLRLPRDSTSCPRKQWGIFVGVCLGTAFRAGKTPGVFIVMSMFRHLFAILGEILLHIMGVIAIHHVGGEQVMYRARENLDTNDPG